MTRLGYAAAALLLALLLPAPAPAAALSGKVVKVVDGDTLVVGRDGVSYRIRLLAIDAPEYRQPYGREARQALEKQVGGKWVTVRYEEKDRYDRYLGTVYYRNANVNLELLRRGHAWVYRDYRHERRLMRLEDEARRKRLGLWRQLKPQAPWSYRRAR